jgi:recombination protein RecR
MKEEILNKLVEKFTTFPGVGRRTAERFAFHILSIKKEEAESLINCIREVKEKIRNCKICNNLTEEEVCSICKDERRDSSLLCVVEQPKDLMAIEKTASYNGKYFVLLGVISPLEGIGVKDIKIEELIEHVKGHPEIKEIIIATDADAEGEATANYLIKALRPFQRKITRIGMGLPIGADLEFVDRTTLQQALINRREV